MFNLKGPQGQNPRTTCGPRTTVWETLLWGVIPCVTNEGVRVRGAAHEEFEVTLIYVEAMETGEVIFTMHMRSAVLVPRRKHDIASAASCRGRQVLLSLMT